MSKTTNITLRILAALIALLAAYAFRESIRRYAVLAAPPTPIRYQPQDRVAQQRNAIAFLLGWDSELVLVEEDPRTQQEYLLSIKTQLHDLGLEPKLKHPLEYYFHLPVDDKGQHAQEFADEVMATLSKSSPETANHFGAGHNLLLDLVDPRITEAERRTNLEKLVQAVDIPADLKRLPAENLMSWANNIHEYFVSLESPQARTPAEPQQGAQENIFEDPSLKQLFEFCNKAAYMLPRKCPNANTQFTVLASPVVCHWECGQGNIPHQPQHGPWKLMGVQVDNGNGASR